MGVYKREDRNNQHTLKPCWYTDELGSKCKNKGIKLDGFYDIINQRIFEYLNQMIEQASQMNVNETKLIIEQKILTINNDIETRKKSLDRILDAFENGLYSLDQFKERKQKVDDIIYKLQNDVELLNKEYQQYSEKDYEEKIERLKYFKDNIKKEGITDIEMNRLYKLIINYIEWTRTNDDITIDIDYK